MLNVIFHSFLETENINVVTVNQKNITIMSAKIQNMPEAELRLHALKLNKMLGMMKQKGDAEKAALKSQLLELEGKQNEAQNTGQIDSENKALNEQMTSLNQELEEYKNDIQKLDLEKTSLDEKKSVEIRALNEKLKMMDEERVREKDILKYGFNSLGHLFILK